MIAIMGASGRTGGRISERLLERGEDEADGVLPMQEPSRRRNVSGA